MTLATDTEQTGDTETRVGHTKADETDVYAGRGPNAQDMTETPVGERGWLGNPFALDDIDEDDTKDDETVREASIRQFRSVFEDELQSNKKFRDAVRELHGKVLGCWCQHLEDESPACHAEVVAEWADKLARETDPETESPSPSPIHLRDHAEIDRITDLVLLLANQDGATYETMQRQLEALDLSQYPVDQDVIVDEPIRRDDVQPPKREPHTSLGILVTVGYVEEFHIPVDETEQIELTEEGKRAASALRDSFSEPQEDAFQAALSTGSQ